MNNIYTCTLRRDFIKAYVNSELEISPRDYLYCYDEDDLKYAIQDDLCSIANIGELDYDYFESTIHIPDEFIEEWKYLKKNEATGM